MSIKVNVKTELKIASLEDSFIRITTTAKGDSPLLPHFGCEAYTLIDKNMDSLFLMLFKKYLFECFFDENDKPWDARLNPKSVDITSIDTTKNTITASINFEEFSIEAEYKGF